MCSGPRRTRAPHPGSLSSITFDPMPSVLFILSVVNPIPMHSPAYVQNRTLTSHSTTALALPALLSEHLRHPLVLLRLPRGDTTCLPDFYWWRSLRSFVVKSLRADFKARPCRGEYGPNSALSVTANSDTWANRVLAAFRRLKRDDCSFSRAKHPRRLRSPLGLTVRAVRSSRSQVEYFHPFDTCASFPSHQGLVLLVQSSSKLDW
jgi:hypothetical protein